MGASLRIAAAVVMLSSLPCGAGRFRHLTVESLWQPDSSVAACALVVGAGAARGCSSSAAPVPAPLELQLGDIARHEFHEAVAMWQLQNLLGAMQLFLRSAQKGHEVGELCFRWGQYHELPPPDIKQAMRWYTRGVRMNHKACTTMLGKLKMAVGQPEEATSILRRTAMPASYGGEHGDSLAQWFLAEMNLQTGQFREAVRWWKRSAENGDVDAMMRLSAVFSQGAAGIPREEARSQHWLLAAAASGHQEALTKVPWSMDEANLTKVARQWMGEMQDMGWL